MLVLRFVGGAPSPAAHTDGGDLMPAFRHAIEIKATPEQVWAVLGDLASADRWIPGVTSVRVDGMTRVCAFADGHSQTEQIQDYSAGSRSYRYQIEGAPLPVTDNIGAFAVTANGTGAQVVWESSFTAADPAMADQLAQRWEPYLPMVLNNLKTVVESR
jgi:carbon monoxide dehydrogenase subunit G